MGLLTKVVAQRPIILASCSNLCVLAVVLKYGVCVSRVHEDEHDSSSQVRHQNVAETKVQLRTKYPVPLLLPLLDLQDQLNLTFCSLCEFDTLDVHRRDPVFAAGAADRGVLRAGDTQTGHGGGRATGRGRERTAAGRGQWHGVVRVIKAGGGRVGVGGQ